MNTDLFGGVRSEGSHGRIDSVDLPAPTHRNQHEIDARIASVMMAQFNNSLATYVQAKREGRYETKSDLLGETSNYDEAKDAMFDSLFWAYGLAAFDHVGFDAVCRFAGDDLYGDPESIRCFLSRTMKSEIQEMVWMIEDHKGAHKAQQVISKLSEYVACQLRGDKP